MPKIYALIPARKGSKRLPQKNVRSLNGKLLVEYAIIEAMKSKYITEVFITTDDPVVIRLANKYKIKYRQRPNILCEDNTSMQDVINDFMMWIPYDRQPDAWVLLQPTSPLRKVEDIDKCIEVFNTDKFDSVISLKEISPNTYYPNGAVYVFKNNIYSDNMGFVLMLKKNSIDIDTIDDFDLAKIIMGRKDEGIPSNIQ
jgi:N-acylneuraminate cytidylyltransferase/CMP-N,N'-diacetyllegionaminic acid synthase